MWWSGPDGGRHVPGSCTVRRSLYLRPRSRNGGLVRRLLTRRRLAVAAAGAVLLGSGVASAVVSAPPIPRVGTAQVITRTTAGVVQRFHEDGRWLAAAHLPGNPFAGVDLYVDPDTKAAEVARELRTRDPAAAALVARIAEQPQARWLGDWSPLDRVRADVAAYVGAAARSGTLPVLVLYAIPHRDCGLYSAGGLDASTYRSWIREVAAGIGTGDVVVVLEPDALAGLDCLDATRQRQRTTLLAEAVDVLAANPSTAVYLDAGNSAWKSEDVIAKRLRAAGIADARGFALNISNYHATADEVAYGKRVSAAVGGKPFVVDTSRNGRGPGDTWCNPRGRGLGSAPTAATREPLVDAYYWFKRPGESDGECGRGDPAAGQWWHAGALELARNRG